MIIIKCETEGEGDDVMGTKLTNRRGALVPPKMLEAGKQYVHFKCITDQRTCNYKNVKSLSRKIDNHKCHLL